MEPKAAFAAFTDELALALHRRGLELEPKAHGVMKQGDKEVARVAMWLPGKRVLILGGRVEWSKNAEARIDFRFQSTKRGTLLTIDHSGLGRLLDAKEGEVLGWFTDQVAASLINASVPSKLGDWITDRRARSPTGASARKGYRNPTHHRPNFKAILEELRLSPNDYLLEVGCGGGAFLNDALKSGCRASAVDHSLEMVRTAKQGNLKTIREKRLEVRESEADTLPFRDSTFTCAVMTSVLGFLPDPVKVFAEIRRVLEPGGRMIVFSTSKEAKGTIAAPEPMASRIHFYEDSELEHMAIEAGFSEAHVKRPDLSKYAKVSEIPKTDQPSFLVNIGQLLLAKKS
jgi:SAM-dependent methyltransferase